MVLLIPKGFRFAPTDEDLVTGYLRRKVKGEALPFEGAVIERDIYIAAPWNVLHDQDPWNTFKIKTKKYEHVIYVFTKLKKIGAKRRVIRRAGDCGTWDGRTKSEKICNEQNELIGFKKMLNFEADANKKDECLMHARGHWIMHEYSLGGVSLDGIEDDHDYVVCKIKRDDSKPLKTSTKHGRDGVDEVSGSSKALDLEYPTRKKMRHDHEASTSKSFDERESLQRHSIPTKRDRDGDGDDDVSGLSKAIVEDPTAQSSYACLQLSESLQRDSILEHLDSETALFLDNVDFEAEQIVGAYAEYLMCDDFTSNVDFETAEQVGAYSGLSKAIVEDHQQIDDGDHYLNFNNHQTAEPLRYQLLNQLTFANSERCEETFEIPVGMSTEEMDSFYEQTLTAAPPHELLNQVASTDSEGCEEQFEIPVGMSTEEMGSLYGPLHEPLGISREERDILLSCFPEQPHFFCC